jgi:hypothetical protein
LKDSALARPDRRIWLPLYAVSEKLTRSTLPLHLAFGSAKYLFLLGVFLGILRVRPLHRAAMLKAFCVAEKKLGSHA